jgi:hypothetical protein
MLNANNESSRRTIMNSLKNLFFLAILAAVGWGLYVSIMRSPEPPGAPPPGVTQSSDAPPTVDLGQAAIAPQFPAANPLSPAPANTTAGAASGGVAPPFVSPGIAAAPAATTSGAPAAALPSVPPALPSATAGPAPIFSGSPPPTNGASSAATPTGIPPAVVVAPEKNGDPDEKIKAIVDGARAKFDEGHMAEAHLLLSSLYRAPGMSAKWTRDVNEMLDQMAGTVIYSRQHLLESPYKVQAGDSLDRIADMYNVPSQLLARINGIRDPESLRPGRELKVVRGPFSAIIDLGKFELTLMLQERYAGRFPIGVGTDRPTLEGSYVVKDKRIVGGPGVAPDPNASFGKFYIDLGSGIGIHGTADPRGIRRADNRGTICLSDQDIDDVFGILSVGSRVTIVR